MQPRGRSHIERSRVERGRMQAAVFHTYTHKCARVHVNTNGAGSVSRRVGGVTDGGGGDLSLRAVSWRRPARDPWPLRRINHEAVPSRFFISRAESYCPAPPPPFISICSGHSHTRLSSGPRTAGITPSLHVYQERLLSAWIWKWDPSPLIRPNPDYPSALLLHQIAAEEWQQAGTFRHCFAEQW